MLWTPTQRKHTLTKVILITEGSFKSSRHNLIRHRITDWRSISVSIPEAASMGMSPLSMLPAWSGEGQGNAQVLKNEHLECLSEEESRRIQCTEAGRRGQLFFKCSTPCRFCGCGILTVNLRNLFNEMLSKNNSQKFRPAKFKRLYGN